MTYGGGPSCNYTYEFLIDRAPVVIPEGAEECDPEVDEDCETEVPLPELAELKNLQLTVEHATPYGHLYG